MHFTVHLYFTSDNKTLFVNKDWINDIRQVFINTLNIMKVHFPCVYHFKPTLMSDIS